MRRIATTAATVAIAVSVLFTAAPAQADDSDTSSSSGADTPVIHHRFQLHYLDREPHMRPRGMTHSVRQAHRPGH